MRFYSTHRTSDFLAALVISGLYLAATSAWAGPKIIVTKAVEAHPISLEVENAQASDMNWDSSNRDPFATREKQISSGKGTRLNIAIRHDKWAIKDMAPNDVRIKSIKDDNGTSLSGLFSNFTTRCSVPEKTGNGLITLSTRFLPSHGASSITVKGTVKVRAARKRKQLRTNPIPIREGMEPVTIKLGEHELTLEWEGQSNGQPEIALEYKGSMDFIEQIQFQTGGGAVIQHFNSGSSSSGSSGRRTRESRDYQLRASVSAIVIAAEIWTDSIEKTVPLDLTFDLNMGAHLKKQQDKNAEENKEEKEGANGAGVRERFKNN